MSNNIQNINLISDKGDFIIKSTDSNTLKTFNVEILNAYNAKSGLKEQTVKLIFYELLRC